MPMRHHHRRGLLLGAAAAAAASVTGAPRPALAYPDRPVRIVVPWPPGAFTDVGTRALAQAMTGSLGQPVVVENRAGANGALGAEAVARAAPDGYTLLVGSTETQAINVLVNRRLAYDPVADFAPITQFARVPGALVVGPGLRDVTDLAGFLARVRAAPGRTTFASWGVAGISHLLMERILRSAGEAQMLHVPFTGAAPALTAVAGGQVDCMIILAGTAMTAARSGRVRVLAVAAERRLPQMPEVPTLAEFGLDVVGGNWFALFGPARMPDAAVRRIAEAAVEAVRAPAVVELFRTLSAEVVTSASPEALRDFVAAERARWGEVIRALDIQLD